MDRALISHWRATCECGKTVKKASALIDLKKAFALQNAPCQKSLSFTRRILAYGRKTLHEWSNVFVKGACVACCWDTLWGQALAGSRELYTLFSWRLKWVKFWSSVGLLTVRSWRHWIKQCPLYRKKNSALGLISTLRVRMCESVASLQDVKKSKFLNLEKSMVNFIFIRTF